MSLKNFHVFFISTALTLLAFMAYWSGRSLQPGTPALLAVSLAGLGLGAGYLGWFLRKSKGL